MSLSSSKYAQMVTKHISLDVLLSLLDNPKTATELGVESYQTMRKWEGNGLVAKAGRRGKVTLWGPGPNLHRLQQEAPK